MTDLIDYQMTPADHLKLAEKYAHWADPTVSPQDTDAVRQVNATLAVAHAQIALAQMRAGRGGLQ